MTQKIASLTLKNVNISFHTISLSFAFQEHFYSRSRFEYQIHFVCVKVDLKKIFLKTKQSEN